MPNDLLTITTREWQKLADPMDESRPPYLFANDPAIVMIPSFQERAPAMILMENGRSFDVYNPNLERIHVVCRGPRQAALTALEI